MKPITEPSGSSKVRPSKAKPGVIVLTGYGINCEEETCWAFERAGARGRIVHVNDLVEAPRMLDDCQIFVVPGGFSYGDDTGSGKALANKLRNRLSEELQNFVDKDRLVLGVCNGFQVLTSLGLLPFRRVGEPRVALTHNRSARYECRWVTLKVEQSVCVFTRNLKVLRIPVAHGEGRFTTDGETYRKLEEGRQIALRYAFSDGRPAGGRFPYNPNGSLGDVAGICDPTGRVFGLMPHPERAFLFIQRDDWFRTADRLRREGKELPTLADGALLFQNAVAYFG